MSKGAIVLIPFPFTDLSGQKVRPSIVLHASKNGEDCIVAFISSLKQRGAGSFDVAIIASSKNGLKVDSVVKINKIATLQKKIILGELGVLEPSLMAIVNKKLKVLFGI